MNAGDKSDGIFKVGDQVILNEHRDLGGSIGKYWTPDMMQYVGKKATITKIHTSKNGPYTCYIVDICTIFWSWRGVDLTRVDSTTNSTNNNKTGKFAKCAVCIRCRTPAEYIDYDPAFKCWSCRN